MHTDTTASQPLNTAAISDELARSLRRYERLCSMPRHLQFPLVGDLDAVSRMARKARHDGRLTRADELDAMLEAEYARREQADRWRTGQADRSAACWAGLQCRLWNARQDAVAAGLLDRGSDSYRFVSDRYDDVCRRLAAAQRAELTITLVVVPRGEWLLPSARA